jgi:hypothetical protein
VLGYIPVEAPVVSSCALGDVDTSDALGRFGNLGSGGGWLRDAESARHEKEFVIGTYVGY